MNSIWFNLTQNILHDSLISMTYEARDDVISNIQSFWSLSEEHRLIYIEGKTTKQECFYSLYETIIWFINRKVCLIVDPFWQIWIVEKKEIVKYKSDGMAHWYSHYLLIWKYNLLAEILSLEEEQN